jgi:L-aspartate oxidase
MSQSYDVIVIGSGIAGLSFALKVAEAGQRVAIITKKNSAESNTNYAQGGIAAVTSQTDDVEMHVADTLDAGDGLCDEAAVREILTDGAASIEELAQRGVAFTQLDDGTVSLGKEGGHSQRRILHVKDVTGKAIEDALLHGIATSPNIETFEHHFAVELITAAKLNQSGADRLVCAQHENRAGGDFSIQRGIARNRWHWSGLSIHHQSFYCDWRWYRDGLSCWSRGA